MLACLLALHSQPSNPDMNVQLASSQCTIQLATIKARASLVRTTGATSAEQANAVVFVRAAAVVVNDWSWPWSMRAITHRSK